MTYLMQAASVWFKTFSFTLAFRIFASRIEVTCEVESHLHAEKLGETRRVSGFPSPYNVSPVSPVGYKEVASLSVWGPINKINPADPWAHVDASYWLYTS